MKYQFFNTQKNASMSNSNVASLNTTKRDINEVQSTTTNIVILGKEM